MKILYTGFIKKFLKGATKEEALDEILREDSQNDTESTQNNTDE